MLIYTKWEKPNEINRPNCDPAPTEEGGGAIIQIVYLTQLGVLSYLELIMEIQNIIIEGVVVNRRGHAASLKLKHVP